MVIVLLRRTEPEGSGNSQGLPRVLGIHSDHMIISREYPTVTYFFHLSLVLSSISSPLFIGKEHFFIAEPWIVFLGNNVRFYSLLYWYNSCVLFCVDCVDTCGFWWVTENKTSKTTLFSSSELLVWLVSGNILLAITDGSQISYN